ncbi:MAG: hypothetical protein QGH26_04350 [Candidatus Pacebacteria bacterium]|nr:hypothetical protein [Candidatus Paceibacterota bacterium]
MSNKKNVLFLREEYGDGQGTYIYHHGFKYVGEWKDNKNTVKEHTLLLMETGLKGNGRMVKHGTEQDTTKTEISNTSW